MTDYFKGLEMAPFSQTFMDPQSEEDLQRTEKWFKDREGCFTGSRNKDLMSCDRSVSKKDWGSPEKLVGFGRAAEKYIYNVGKERKTKIRSMEVHSRNFNHGKEYEPLLVEKIIDDGLISDFEPCMFVQFPTEQLGGASADGKCLHKTERVGLETKCCVSWDGHFARMYDDVSDKHDDFWQFQSEMLALDVDKLLYVVASPGQVDDYEYKIIEASKLHQQCLLKRIQIANDAIALWGKYSYSEALAVACANYEDL